MHTTALCWTARLTGLLSIIVLVVFLLMEGFYPSELAGVEWLLFFFFPAGVAVGLVIGWLRPAPGGGVAIGSLLVFYVLHPMHGMSFPDGWSAPKRMPMADRDSRQRVEHV